MSHAKHDWKKVLISPDIKVMSAIEQLDASGLRILLVVNQAQHLLGVITDGNIRRYLLKHGNLDVQANEVMNANPVSASAHYKREKLLSIVRDAKILQLPLVDNSKKVVGLETLDSLANPEEKENWVMFMAGGLGKRLHPLTLDCPKPLLKIGEKPILEILLENFIKHGFRKFYFSINYMGEMIREYFGSGDKWGVEIRYVEEKNALGTAGSLSLLPEIPNEPFFVVNADILTNVNFDIILDYHTTNPNQSLATVCVRQHESTIPFGVVHIDDQDCGLTDVEEKPTKSYFVNAGIYVVSPEALQYLNYNNYCDMPTFLLKLVEQKKHVGTFPIREYWLDIGHHDNLMRAASDYLEVFC